jgi:hypothetical protein
VGVRDLRMSSSVRTVSMARPCRASGPDSMTAG